MSDVSVMLLTLGEPTTAEALESIRRQTIPPAEVIEVSGVRPLRDALNAGVARARSPLLLQVDADMVLDPHCIEVLRAAICADPAIGVAVGHLRDALVGRVCGIKMFRRECFEGRRFGSGIAPDTDLIDGLRQSGWRDVYILDHTSARKEVWHTVGQHVPRYDDRRYTYAKYLHEGACYRYRGDVNGLRWHLGALHRSRHPSAPIARIALLNGALAKADDELTDRERSLPDFEALEAFMASGGESPASASIVRLYISIRPTRLFRRYYALGATLRRAGAYRTFERISQRLATVGDRSYWIALMGLYSGVRADIANPDREAGEPDAAIVARVRPLLPSMRELVVGKAGDLARALRLV